MPVVSDYIMIEGANKQVSIGSDGDNRNGWTSPPFDTGGRHGGSAYISVMVSGMTDSAQNAKVFLNNRPEEIGHLLRNNGGSSSHCNMQTVVFSGSLLNDGKSRLRIEAVDKPDGTRDAFKIRNPICHFHQDT